MRLYSCILFAAIFLGAGVASASDLEKEARWEEQIVDALFDGEPIKLNDGRSDFLAIETESADGGISKAAIVMHGTGVHPDWVTVVQPLRVRLTESGWHTLSIQMPVLPNEAEHAEYAAIYGGVPGRIEAAVTYLRDKGAAKVVLIAHSQGATMTTYHLSQPHQPVDGFVAIGMSAGIAGGPMDTLAQLPTVGVPLLDLHGSEDLEEVLVTADARAEAASTTDYVQKEVADADHFFEGEEEQLLEAVNEWLDARFK